MPSSCQGGPPTTCHRISQASENLGQLRGHGLGLGTLPTSHRYHFPKARQQEQDAGERHRPQWHETEARKARAPLRVQVPCCLAPGANGTAWGMQPAGPLSSVLTVMVPPLLRPCRWVCGCRDCWAQGRAGQGSQTEAQVAAARAGLCLWTLHPCPKHSIPRWEAGWGPELLLSTSVPRLGGRHSWCAQEMRVKDSWGAHRLLGTAGGFGSKEASAQPPPGHLMGAGHERRRPAEISFFFFLAKPLQPEVPRPGTEPEPQR